MVKDDCIFCKRANGILPTNTVYEDDDFRVIMDAAPAAMGHALVIPKAHYDNALNAEPGVLGSAMEVAADIARAVKKATGCDGVNILQNNGEAAGQTVFHLHIHVIPRFNDDKVNFSYESLNPAAEDVAAMAKKIADNL